MTVDDVIKMVQVKLGDDLVISQIKKNGKPFALSADDMVRLKTAGASDGVIRAMINPQGVEAPPSQGSAAVVQFATAGQPLPSAYGYYLYDQQKFVELAPVQVDTVFGLTLADRGFAVDGIRPSAQLLQVDSQSPTLILYQQNVVPSTLKLSALTLVSSMKAYEFNIINTAPAFFSSLYRKNPNDTIPVDLMRPSREIQIRIEPVDGKPGMYKLIPVAPLGVGKYALGSTDSLHPENIVFSASVGRKSAALAFEVVRSTAASPTPSGAGSPQLTAGILYLAKADGKMTALSPRREARIRFALRAGRTVELNGEKSSTRFNRQEKDVFLVSTPPTDWGEGEYKLYVCEVKNDKRIAAVHKKWLTYSVEPRGQQFVQIVIGGELPPGEYVFVHNEATSQSGGSAVRVVAFGVD